jgi:hypothetical protein
MSATPAPPPPAFGLFQATLYDYRVDPLGRTEPAPWVGAFSPEPLRTNAHLVVELLSPERKAALDAAGRAAADAALAGLQAEREAFAADPELQKLFALRRQLAEREAEAERQAADGRRWRYEAERRLAELGDPVQADAKAERADAAHRLAAGHADALRRLVRNQQARALGLLRARLEARAARLLAEAEAAVAPLRAAVEAAAAAYVGPALAAAAVRNLLTPPMGGGAPGPVGRLAETLPDGPPPANRPNT